MKNILQIIALIIFTISFSSCENESWEFDDYEFQTVYFAYQYPVRTITQGEDIFDTSLDNEGRAKIMATTGGTYNNDQDIFIDITVDNSLTQGLVFDDNRPVRAMPENYYSLESEEIRIPEGELTGGVEFQLTDAFFNDSLSFEKNYVIPVVMTNVVGADSILVGRSLASSPRRIVAEDWDVLPKDFILYAVKYVNPWHGNYLRRGVDNIAGTPGNENTVTRSEEYVVDDEVVALTTTGRDAVRLDLVFTNSDGYEVNCTLILTLDETGNISISAASDQYEASGSGQFIKDGEKNSWGGKDRDALYLNYEINLDEINVTTTDTLVLRDRGVSIETFSPVVN